MKRDELPKLYRLAQLEFEPLFTRLARNAVLRVSGDYQAPQYWLKRSDIGESMRSSLVEDLGKAFADVTGFMLLKIDLPDVYEGAIVNTEVTNQQKITYTTLRAVNETQQVTENIKSAALARINIINSGASSNATIIINNGAGEVAKQNIDLTSQAL